MSDQYVMDIEPDSSIVVTLDADKVHLQQSVAGVSRGATGLTADEADHLAEVLQAAAKAARDYKPAEAQAASETPAPAANIQGLLDQLGITAQDLADLVAKKAAAEGAPPAQAETTSTEAAPAQSLSVVEGQSGADVPTFTQPQG